MVALSHFAFQVPRYFLLERKLVRFQRNMNPTTAHLESITDTQNRDSQIKHSGVDMWRIGIVDRVWRPRENDSCPLRVSQGTY